MPHNNNNKRIPKFVIARLPSYYRIIREIYEGGAVRTSSAEIAKGVGNHTPSQVRQDLAFFGCCGQHGIGYNTEKLYNEVKAAMGFDKTLKTIIIGAGNLGRAIGPQFSGGKNGCELVGVFDKNTMHTGASVGGQKVRGMDKLKAFCEKEKPQVAVLCVPKKSAKEIYRELISYGITAFWNFSGFDIRSALIEEGFNYPEDIIIEDVFLTDSLLHLTYNINNKKP